MNAAIIIQRASRPTAPIWRIALAACLLAGSLLRSSAAPPAFADLGIVEIELTSDRDYEEPLADAYVNVEAKSPGGKTHHVEAFWDGVRNWRARWRGDERGQWTWTAKSNLTLDAGLNAQGAITHNGPAPPAWLRTSADGSHLETAAGQPFFWLADTAWNGALRSTDAEWNEYLALRAKQRFTAIQFVTTQWRGGDKVIPRQVFVVGGVRTEAIQPNPDAFADLDDKIAAIVRHGLRPAPVMLWANTRSDPGQALPARMAQQLARYEIARWGCLAPAWLLGGDGNYLREAQVTSRWKDLGRSAFNDCPEQLVTLHPSGLSWIADAFADEKWLDFVGYQSGHGDGDKDLNWLVSGPPAHAENVGKPAINLEPNYEGHPAYQSGKPHTPANVRRAVYWSLLVSPTAGVTYGNNQIWCWNTETADAENHGNLPQIRPWRDGLRTDGIAQMTHLRDFFDSGPWWRLRPAQQLVGDQPGDADPRRFIAVAQTPDADWIVAYFPGGGRHTLSGNLSGRTAAWFNPRDGSSRPTAPVMPAEGAPQAAPGARTTFAAPDDDDWILSIR